MTRSVSQEDAIYSTLGNDPELGELVSMFVDELQQRVDHMAECVQEEDWQQLGRAAHQLKGAAGSYGFQQLTPVLQQLESSAKQADDPHDTLKAFEVIVRYCDRVRAGGPD